MPDSVLIAACDDVLKSKTLAETLIDEADCKGALSETLADRHSVISLLRERSSDNLRLIASTAAKTLAGCIAKARVAVAMENDVIGMSTATDLLSVQSSSEKSDGLALDQQV